jgi:hypothetical protein
MSKPNTIMIDDQEYVRADSVKAIEVKIPGGDASPYILGKKYAIRTVTMAYVGQLVSVTDKELVLVKASWIADTGRFSEFVAGGEANEIEPFPPERLVIVGRGALIDAVEWSGELPKEKK